MKDNATFIPCQILKNCTDPKYDEKIRRFQGCPTLAITKGGRIYLGWYAGGYMEPHMDNYNILVYSDDDGKSWSDPIVIIPSSKENFIHALDIQLFVDADNKLHVCWVQNNTKPAPESLPKYPDGCFAVIAEGFLFDDFRHSQWEMVCDDPDGDDPTFSEPRFLFHAFLRCKPTFLKNGDWFYPAYTQLSDKYCYFISHDKGQTFEKREGPKKFPTNWDEAMAYEKLDGSLRMFARNSVGEISEATSLDNAVSWSEATLSGIDNPDTRFFISRTPSGRVLLINNDDRSQRKNMTLYLSLDDGKTWKYKKCIDTRCKVSYPDADFKNGKIYLSYDYERCRENEILFTCFTEEDIMDPDKIINVSIVSKP